MKLEELKYPIGMYVIPDIILESHLTDWINSIKTFPQRIEAELQNLNTNQLAYKYRPQGWTIKQVVNHCVDSHMNSVIRFKLALTEKNPVIRPYKEHLWAELSDTVDYDIMESMKLLKAIHHRWICLLESLTKADYLKTFVHPSGNEIITLEENLCIYSWHCEHHLKHVKNAKEFRY